MRNNKHEIRYIELWIYNVNVNSFGCQINLCTVKKHKTTLYQTVEQSFIKRKIKPNRGKSEYSGGKTHIEKP